MNKSTFKCEKCNVKITKKNFWNHKHDCYITTPKPTKNSEVKE